jgi:hypothetical protein
MITKTQILKIQTWDQPVKTKTFPIYIDCLYYRIIDIKLTTNNLIILNKTDACSFENNYRNVFWIKSGVVNSIQNYSLNYIEYTNTNKTNYTSGIYNFTQTFVKYIPEEVVSIKLKLFTSPSRYEKEDFEITFVRK